FVGIWNEFLLALIILARDSLKTLPLGLANLQMVMQYQTDWGALFAGLVLAVVPILIGFVLLNRQITEGVTLGAVKG
ncbi:MAG: carbohydrate ABC transporter permease, partial [Bacillota bacterium]